MFFLLLVRSEQRRCDLQTVEILFTSIFLEEIRYPLTKLSLMLNKVKYIEFENTGSI